MVSSRTTLCSTDTKKYYRALFINNVALYCNSVPSSEANFLPNCNSTLIRSQVLQLFIAPNLTFIWPMYYRCFLLLSSLLSSRAALPRCWCFYQQLNYWKLDAVLVSLANSSSSRSNAVVYKYKPRPTVCFRLEHQQRKNVKLFLSIAAKGNGLSSLFNISTFF
jgi:hypothetical protein